MSPVHPHASPPTAPASPPTAPPSSPPTALVTGGSAGLGRELVLTLAHRGWRVVTDARDAALLAEVAEAAGPAVVAVPGDVADRRHRDDLVGAVERLGRLDLLVHNASTLGPLPLRRLRETEAHGLHDAWATNVEAAHALTVRLVDHLVAHEGVLLSLSSDAAVEHYPTWGAYAASKAALDHLTLTWAVEENLDAYAVDPGDMRTAMHQAAFPGEDISDRPDPATVVPRLLALVAHRPPSGRYRLADLDLDHTATQLIGDPA